MARPYDRTKAAAESRLEALDDAEILDEPPAEAPDATEDVVASEPQTIDPEEYGFHVDDPDADLLDDDLDAGLRDDEEATLLDAVAEAFNARDLDQLMAVLASDAESPGLLGFDRDNLPEAIEDLWQRRPTGCLTRGYHGEVHVGVLWEHDGAAWWRVAAVHVDDVGDGTVGVLEFTEDPSLLDELIADPPDPDELDEGARWSEWEDGDEGSGG